MNLARLRRLLPWLFGAVVAGVATVLLCDRAVAAASRGKVFDSPAALPKGPDVALVLGCNKVLSDGRTNYFFRYRIQAARQLWKSGKLRALIVSGDNSRHGYDEPSDMKAALVAAGVPEHAVHCDYAGFSTLDSVIRAERIFGQKQFIIVSQRFHNERAIYLAQAHGLKAVGFNAKDVRISNSLRTHLREWMARVAAVLDVHVLHTEPRFSGPRVQVL